MDRFLLGYAIGRTQRPKTPKWAVRVWLAIGIAVVLFGLWLFQ